MITHWGFSAPAVIKLSAWAALDLHAKAYDFPILISWSCLGEDELRAKFQAHRSDHPKKQVVNFSGIDIPGRLWQHLCEKASIDVGLTYDSLKAKQRNKLIELLVRSEYDVKGKTTFKEEFVTAGGIALKEVNMKTFESLKIPGLYLTGEVLNVDGVTGGFNFQHAWSSAYVAGRAAAG